jgi:two-component sensor histidine kinase
MEVPGLRRKSGEIYTLLSELYTNALEHGVLGLSSGWKATPDGFGRYYAERERRLQSVSDHFIRFTLSHTMTDRGGQLTIVCEDSGSGFDHLDQSTVGDESGYSGRGLMLLRKLGHSLSFREYGTRAEIIYDWHFSEVAAREGSLDS